MRPLDVDVFPAFGQVVPALVAASANTKELNESKVTREKTASDFFISEWYVI